MKGQLKWRLLACININICAKKYVNGRKKVNENENVKMSYGMLSNKNDLIEHRHDDGWLSQRHFFFANYKRNFLQISSFCVRSHDHRIDKSLASLFF